MMYYLIQHVSNAKVDIYREEENIQANDNPLYLGGPVEQESKEPWLA